MVCGEIINFCCLYIFLLVTGSLAIHVCLGIFNGKKFDPYSTVWPNFSDIYRASETDDLYRALFLVPRTRLDLLPFYSRLVATLQPLMPDLATDLVNMLRQDFKYQVRKKVRENT